MRKTPRWYQERCTRKIMEKVREPDTHPVAAVPGGAGKSLILCMITGEFLDEQPDKEVLILCDVAEILEQDHKALEEYFYGIEIGLYSAGLGEKDNRRITVAGIQSVWKKPELFQNVSLIIIDEAHGINPKEEGMYREFLGYLDATYVGLTATPFRLGHGYIYKGDNALFNCLAYDLTSTKNYNKLVRQGYLSEMYPRKTMLSLDLNKVRTRGGDYATEDLSKNIDRDAITDVACNEILMSMKELGLKKGLIFSIDIAHAQHIHAKLLEIGVKAGLIHSKINKSRKKIYNAFRKGEYEALVNVDMATTGLDVPDIDFIVLLRPTKSPSLHVQMLARGSRVVYANGYDLSSVTKRKLAIKNGPKKYCIVMDFAGNVARLGPINDVQVIEKKEKKGSGGKGEAITKVCPECKTINPAAKRECMFCGFEFEFKQHIKIESSNEDIIKTKNNSKESDKEIIDKAVAEIRKQNKEMKNGFWFNVTGVEYRINSNPGRTSSLKVVYHCGLRTFNEYICIEHGGYPRYLAKQWIKFRMSPNQKKPNTLAELYASRHGLAIPKKIFIQESGRYKKVSDYIF